MVLDRGVRMNKSVMKCCICNNENIGQFITINNKKYHLCCIEQLQQENKKLNGTIQTYDILLKANVEENKQLKNLIDIILNFSFFKGECPLNFGFENNTNEDKSQSVFYEDEWCEDNCNDNYKDCWLKYFKKLQELERSDSNV